MKCITLIIGLLIAVCRAQNDNHDDDPRFTKAITLAPPPAFQYNDQQYTSNNLNTYNRNNQTAGSYSNSNTNNNAFIPSQPITHLDPIPTPQQPIQQYSRQNQAAVVSSQVQTTIQAAERPTHPAQYHQNAITTPVPTQGPRKTYKTYKIIIERRKAPRNAPTNDGRSMQSNPSGQTSQTQPKEQTFKIIYQKPFSSPKSNPLPKKSIQQQQQQQPRQQQQQQQPQHPQQQHKFNYVLPPHHVVLPKVHTPAAHVGANLLSSFSEGELVQIVQAISPENFNLLKITEGTNMKPVIKPIAPSVPVYPKYYNPLTHGKFIQVIPHDHNVPQHPQHSQQVMGRNNVQQKSPPHNMAAGRSRTARKRETLLSESIPTHVLARLPPRFRVVRRISY